MPWSSRMPGRQGLEFDELFPQAKLGLGIPAKQVLVSPCPRDKAEAPSVGP